MPVVNLHQSPEAKAQSLSSCRHCRFRSSRRSALRFFLLAALLRTFADVDAALEERAVFNRDARGHDVAGQRSVTANVDAVARGQIAAHLAEHDDLAGINVGGDYTVASYRHAIAGQIDRT